MKPGPSNLAAQLRDTALGAGCCAFGICSTERFDAEIAVLQARKGAGMSGRLGFTYADPERAGEVRRSLPWASSLVVAAWPYLPEAGDPGPGAAGTGRIARFATADHYRGLRSALEGIGDLLEANGYRSTVLADDARLIDRAAAVRAGVGWWGKSAMVLVPGSGPWVLLGSVATDAELPRSETMRRDCGSCIACIPACPTGALVEPGVLDARLCLAHWLQAPGLIPRGLRHAVADRVYGCDDCLDACPPGERLLRTGLRQRGRVDLLSILGADDAALLSRFGHFYMPDRHPRYLRRNALVALGNTGGVTAAGIVAGFLGHPDWLLRAHAAWAVGELGGSMAPLVLRAARRRERDPRVVEEIDEALAEVGSSR